METARNYIHGEIQTILDKNLSKPDLTKALMCLVSEYQRKCFNSAQLALKNNPNHFQNADITLQRIIKEFGGTPVDYNAGKPNPNAPPMKKISRYHVERPKEKDKKEEPKAIKKADKKNK